jgi:hypothetical protein
MLSSVWNTIDVPAIGVAWVCSSGVEASKGLIRITAARVGYRTRAPPLTDSLPSNRQRPYRIDFVVMIANWLHGRPNNTLRTATPSMYFSPRLRDYNEDIPR